MQTVKFEAVDDAGNKVTAVRHVEVVDSIAGVETTAFAPHSDVPVEPVVIIKAEKVD